MPTLADALGILATDDPWWQRAACAGYPLSLFFSERGSNHSPELTTHELRGKRVCARCPVRRECLTETIRAESPQKVIARNAARPQGSWVAFGRAERQLPIGCFGGTLPTERWADDVIHLADCKRSCTCASTRKGTHGPSCKRCQGCRRLPERIEILERRLQSQSPKFLLKSEKITPLG